MEVDNAAVASGMWASGVTGIGAILATPAGAGVWMWLISLIVTGLFGLASSAVTVLLKHYLGELKERKRLRSAEREESSKDRGA